MLNLKKDDRGFYEIIVAGRVDRQEYLDAVQELQSEIAARDGKVNIVKRVDSFEGMDWRLVVQNLGKSFSILPKVNKAAIITDIAWVEKLVTAMDKITSMEVKVFSKEKADDAYDWVSDF